MTPFKKPPAKGRTAVVQNLLVNTIRTRDIHKLSTFLTFVNPNVWLNCHIGTVRPLHIATECGFPDLIQMLLAHKADVNLGDASGYTALHYAAVGARADLARLLLDSGAEVDPRDHFRHTPLHLAVCCPGNVDVVRLLLLRGAEIDARDCNLATPLIYAMQIRNNVAILTLLCHHGANLDLPNLRKLPPLYVGILCGSKENVEVLVSYGAGVALDPSLILKINEEGAKNVDVLAAKLVLLKHLVKLNSLNLLGDARLLGLRAGTCTEDVEQVCREEIARMRLTLVYPSRNVTFCEVLTRSAEFLALHLENEQVKSSLVTTKFEKVFPQYSYMFKYHVRRALMLAKSYGSLRRILGRLPFNCVRRIHGYLGERDRRALSRV